MLIQVSINKLPQLFLRDTVRSRGKSRCGNVIDIHTLAALSRNEEGTRRIENQIIDVFFIFKIIWDLTIGDDGLSGLLVAITLIQDRCLTIAQGHSNIHRT